jgi:hypothetical protein
MSLASYVTQGSQLLGRVFSIALSANDGTASVWGNEKPGQSPLRVHFQIERNAEGPADAKITLYNLNPTSRNIIQNGVQVDLRAGYTGSMAKVFAGVVKNVKTQRQGPDVTTEMTCSDGTNFTNYAVLHQSYAAGTPLYRVFEDLAGAMRLDISGDVTLQKNGIIGGIPNETLGRGLVVDGAVRKTLTRLCRPRKLTWSIRNGQLSILPANHYDCMPVVVLNRESGLINIPSFNSELLSLSALLIPGLEPNSLVKVEAQNQGISGTYCIKKQKTEGDTHDSPWSHDLEAYRYTGSLDAIPIERGGNFASAVA